MAEIIPTDAEVKSQYGGLAGVQPVAPITPVTTATPAQVFSPANVAQTTTAPVGPYDYSDPLKLRDRINAELGLNDVQKQYQDAIANLRSFDTGTTNQQFGMDQELNPLGVIRGEQATALGQRSLSRQGMADTAQTLADRYNAVQAQADNKFNILNTERQNLQQLMVSNPGAKISYTDTIEQAAKKIAKHTESVAKDEYKKQLKSAAMQLGIKTSGSTKEIEKRLQKYYGTQAAYSAQIRQLELQAKKQALVKSGTATPDGASAELVAVSNALKANNNDWGATANYLANKGYNVSEGSTIDNELRRRNGLAPIVKPTGKTTQVQETTAGYAQRAKEASDIVGKFSDLGSSGWGTVTQYLPNILKSSDRQQMEQAQRNFVNAVLRPESGAVISDSEFKNAAQQYFPQPGDSASVIAQKAANRETKINNLIAASGQAYQGNGNNAPTIQSQIQELINAGYSPEQIQVLIGQ